MKVLLATFIMTYQSAGVANTISRENINTVKADKIIITDFIIPPLKVDLNSISDKNEIMYLVSAAIMNTNEGKITQI